MEEANEADVWIGGDLHLNNLVMSIDLEKVLLIDPEAVRPRAQDEKGAPDASTDAGVLPARCSSPPAVAAGRDGRPELTKSPPNSGAVRAQSADTSGVV